MNRNLLGIDCDDVLFDLNPIMHDWHNTNYGTKVVFEEIEHFELDVIWQISKGEAVRRVCQFYETGEFKSIPAMTGARNALNMLKKKYDLVVVTSRGNDTKKTTKKQLDEYYGPIFKNIVHTNSFSKSGLGVSKAVVCQNLRIKVFIDDHFDFALDCVSKGIKTFLFRRPWNKKYSDSFLKKKKITPIKSWQEVVEILM